MHGSAEYCHGGDDSIMAITVKKISDKDQDMFGSQGGIMYSGNTQQSDTVSVLSEYASSRDVSQLTLLVDMDDNVCCVNNDVITRLQ